MPLDPDGNTPAAQRQAIGALCLDAGIAAGMRYGPMGSTTYLDNGRYALLSVTMGSANCRPVAGDFDGDGYADFNLFQYSTGNWTLMLSSQGYQPFTFACGAPGDQPAAGDYDGDGLADPAIYKCSSGQWLIFLSGRDYDLVTVTFF